jgi:uncharacterized protein involved in response to NO
MLMNPTQGAGDRPLSDAARRREPPALWSLAFRPFFLAAGVWAAAALSLWVFVLATNQALPSAFDPLSWHIHEMLFGFVTAAIAGFLLTAIPNWTGRPPIQDWPLAGLAALWLLGRVLCLTSAFLPLWLTAAVDVAFPFALGACAAREIVAARNWRNLMMPVPIGILGIADLMMYLELGGADIPSGLGWRLAIAAIIALISAVGGRIIPSFTRNWLAARGVDRLPPPADLIDRLALASLHLGLLAWALLPAMSAIGALLLVAAGLNAWRLARWRGHAVLREPLLVILHLGYLWVAIGAALLGASEFGAAVPESAAIHAFTAGAIGTMILAVMSRVSLGHTGRQLHADHATTACYVLVTFAALTRIEAAIFTSVFLPLIVLSGVLWVAAFVLFVAHYGAILMSPRPR